MKLSRPFRPHDDIAFQGTQGGSPGLRDNAPLALKEDPDFNLGFSIWRSSWFFVQPKFCKATHQRANGP